jgi:hypothetical protein
LYHCNLVLITVIENVASDTFRNSSKLMQTKALITFFEFCLLPRILDITIHSGFELWKSSPNLPQGKGAGVSRPFALAERGFYEHKNRCYCLVFFSIRGFDYFLIKREFFFLNNFQTCIHYLGGIKHTTFF